MNKFRYLVKQKFGDQGELIDAGLYTPKGKAVIEFVGDIESLDMDSLINHLLTIAKKGEPVFTAFGRSYLPYYITSITKEEYLISSIIQNAMLIAEIDITGHIRIPSIGFAINSNMRSVEETFALIKEQLEIWERDKIIESVGGGSSLLSPSSPKLTLIKFWPMYGTDRE